MTKKIPCYECGSINEHLYTGKSVIKPEYSDHVYRCIDCDKDFIVRCVRVDLVVRKIEYLPFKIDEK